MSSNPLGPPPLSSGGKLSCFPYPRVLHDGLLLSGNSTHDFVNYPFWTCHLFPARILIHKLYVCVLCICVYNMKRGNFLQNILYIVLSKSPTLFCEYVADRQHISQATNIGPKEIILISFSIAPFNFYFASPFHWSGNTQGHSVQDLLLHVLFPGFVPQMGHSPGVEALASGMSSDVTTRTPHCSSVLNEQFKNFSVFFSFLYFPQACRYCSAIPLGYQRPGGCPSPTITSYAQPLLLQIQPVPQGSARDT